MPSSPAKTSSKLAGSGTTGGAAHEPGDGGTLKIELDGDVDGQGKLEAGENIDLFSSSSLDFEFVGETNASDLIKAGTYTIVESTSGALQGAFSSVTDLGIYDDDVGVTYNADSVTITLDHDLLAGDASLDGVVNIGDVNTVSQTFNGSGVGGWEDGDFTGDGIVNIADINTMALNFGVSVPAVVPGVVPTPEPAGLALVLMGLLGGSLLRQRS